MNGKHDPRDKTVLLTALITSLILATRSDPSKQRILANRQLTVVAKGKTTCGRTRAQRRGRVWHLILIND